ncbi:hypothetical protein GCM10011507_05770 [Edaphobacter acidisoli]|uniref:ABC transporter domain-containing protein n=1 Tax=Edaphobacter acidisoli TaxID=2040573 RepID=A0A916RIH5_9BACT|nr:ATP-binding cassette domain-containing protein [Edaphobacter acidisoli]GGA57300.1 hypothetical protein GCM10011507_05770 [Edaphobacter acidisoli]
MSANIPPASAPAILEAKLQHSIGGLLLDVNFTLTKPWSVLFGPSGSGKTTLLRAIAGFVEPDSGHIARGDTVLFDSSSNHALPPYLRSIRSAAQTARLFPHKDVRWNILYGNGWLTRPLDASQIAEQTMALFRIDKLAGRMPADLSGGEKQRASVARAVVSAITFSGTGTPLLLLDEPFSGLDAALRDDLLAELREWLDRWKVPVLSVTHDIGEAFQLDAEVLKLAEGRIVEQGPAEAVLATERIRLLSRLG